MPAQFSNTLDSCDQIPRSNGHRPRDKAVDYLRRLLPWYRNLVRRFLEKRGDEKLSALDLDAQHLEKQSKHVHEPVPVCFLGSSGVGKSTLINAIVAGHEIVVPSGGVGPLTARELRIEFGEQRGLAVIYHEPYRVWRLIFALEQMFPEELGRATVNQPATDDVARLISEEDRLELALAKNDDATPLDSKSESYRKLAKLIVCGNQDSDASLPYLVDSLREVIGKRRIYSSEPKDADWSRVERLRSIFLTNDPKSPSCCECTSDDPEFGQLLKDHATGFLAPLVGELSVQWNSEILRSGLQLVDLPGLGVAGDVYRAVTDEWIRKKAEVVVLVVDHRGIREEDADLLRSSGFLGRLLHSADDPSADPVSLVIAVVKIDDIATSRRHEDRSKTRLQHFHEIQVEAKQKLVGQLRDRLRDAWIEGQEGAAKDTKSEIINRLTAQTPVFPLSAIQFRELLANDDDNRPFISTHLDSGVPDFIDGLLASVRSLQLDKTRKFNDRIDIFDTEVRSTMRLIQASLGEATASSEQALKLKEQLDSFLQPLREEMRTRQGQFRGYLKDVLPARIETLTAEARISAAKDIRSYIRKLKDAHWATLRAAIRRGGTYQGSRHIEIPHDFAQALEEPVAEIWGKTILKEVRQRTKEFAEDCHGLTGQVVDWCSAHPDFFPSEVIEAQKEAIAVDSRKLTTIGKEMVDDLRQKVKERLLTAIEAPVRRKCQNFVRKNADVGAGVKLRMHDLIDELLDDSLDAAVPAAQQVLTENYQEIERDIRKAFADYQDPIATVVSTLMEKFQVREDKESRKLRKALVKELEAILSEAPTAA